MNTRALALLLDGVELKKTVQKRGMAGDFASLFHPIRQYVYVTEQEEIAAENARLK
jgi:hypothetical protein